MYFILYTTTFLMFYITFLLDIWHRKATMYGSDQPYTECICESSWLMTDCETRSRCRTFNGNIWKSLVPVARSWQERVASSDQRPTVLCVIVCCWIVLVIVIVPSKVCASKCKKKSDRTSTVLVHDANIWHAMSYWIDVKKLAFSDLLSMLP